MAALFQTFEYSPVGDILNFCATDANKKTVRGEYTDITNAGIAYCLYRYAEKKGIRSLRVSDFYTDECVNGPYKTFGISKTTFVNSLRSLNSEANRVLIAELAMGLDSITLREDLTSISCLESLI